MLRTVNASPTLWESVIPECCLGLPGDLAEIDALLDDERFFAPFRAYFDATFGRPSIWSAPRGRERICGAHVGDQPDALPVDGRQ